MTGARASGAPPTGPQTAAPQAAAPQAADPQATGAQAVGAQAAAPAVIGEEAAGAQVTEVRLIGERVVACAGVAGLSGGLFGTMATYLPGERLTGVSADDHEVNIAIVARLDRPLPETADEVRRAVADLAGDRPVNIRIDDVVPREPDDAVSAGAAPGDSVKETS